VQYAKDRVADVYPAYQLGWFPDFSDADNYLTPFFLNTDTSTAFLQNHYSNPTVNDLIQKEVTTQDKAQRQQVIEQVQTEVAKDLATVPYLQGSQIAVVGKDVSGTQDTLDASFKFRYGVLTKG
jgi:peptide/nickel transport system substrate-binding protein